MAVTGVYKSGSRIEDEGIGLPISNELDGHGTIVKGMQVKSFEELQICLCA